MDFMDLVNKYQKVNIIELVGTKDVYNDRILDIMTRHVMEASSLVAVTYSERPGIYHILKWRYDSRGDTVTRDTLKTMIVELESYDNSIRRDYVRDSNGDWCRNHEKSL